MSPDRVNLRRVTDLDRFALDEIWRPYGPIHPEWASWTKTGSHLTRPPYGLAETAERLRQSSEWSDLVINRLARCGGARFPAYIVSPLVDVVTERVTARIAEIRAAGAGVPHAAGCGPGEVHGEPDPA